jgi:NAD(P)-dependent dehydrogenase (short-subunit alcohol dehydrogenase family)
MKTSENPGGKLSGRVALISGGAQGIGRGVAECMLREGASVILLDCDLAMGQKTTQDLTSRRPAVPVAFVPCDLGNPEDIQSAVKQVQGLHGRLDILVNNAGIELDRSCEEITPPQWDRVLNVNLRGAFLLSQAALPLFPASGGAIVNISSVHATHAFPNAIPYACSKAALVALTRNLALELSSRKIRVNAVCPGYIDTRLWEEYLRHTADPAAVAAETAALHPVGRRGVPADVAEAALYLASDGASFVTGTTLLVDGGLTIRAHQ